MVKPFDVSATAPFAALAAFSGGFAGPFFALAAFPADFDRLVAMVLHLSSRNARRTWSFAGERRLRQLDGGGRSRWVTDGTSWSAPWIRVITSIGRLPYR